MLDNCVHRVTGTLTCLTGLISHPRSDVSAARGVEKHLFFEIAGSSCGIVIGRHSVGRILGVEPSELQHWNVLLLTFTICVLMRNLIFSDNKKS